MQRRTYKRSFFPVLPPHMLDALVLNGNAEQRRWALQTLGHDHTFRLLRATQSLFPTRRTRGRTLLTSDAGLQRMIYNAHGTTNLSNVKIREEGEGPCGDTAANEAYDGLGWTHAFYLQIFGRNSIDDAGMPLDAVVHYGKKYDNAFWNGEYMIFGDGDGELFNRFTLSLDVIGHELTHGVTENEAQLDYIGQAGALNESMSDVFGSLIKQFSRKQTAEQADWLIGEGLFTDKVHGKALRSMIAPGTAFDDPLLGKDPQPGTMQDYVQVATDNGGVHINSGIPNRAFYLVASKIGGFAWERAGRIWYETLRDQRLRPTADFRAFAQLTLENAERLYGQKSREWMAVQEAWDEVGVQRVPMLV